MASRRAIDRLIGVYNADGSLRGELAYALGKLTGRAHCALCDITHRTIRPRREFVAWAEALPVPFDLVHLDERTTDVATASLDNTPCVLASTATGLVVVLGPDELEACDGQPDRLADALRQALEAQDLDWPDAIAT